MKGRLTKQRSQLLPQKKGCDAELPPRLHSDDRVNLRRTTMLKMPTVIDNSLPISEEDASTFKLIGARQQSDIWELERDSASRGQLQQGVGPVESREGIQEAPTAFSPGVTLKHKSNSNAS